MHHIMKIVLRIIFLFLTINSFGQNKQPEDYGFRHLQTIYKSDTIDIDKIKKRGRTKSKTIALICQGSLPQSLIHSVSA